MAPSVTVYFHQIPTVTVAGGQRKRSGVRTTFAVSEAPFFCLKRSKPAATVDYPTMATVTEAMCTPQILKGKAAKGLKKRHARSAKRRLARAIKASATVAVQTAFPEATKVSVLSIPGANLQKRKLVRVPKDLPHTITNAGVQPITQIMIGSIPVSLVTVESVMVTFAEEDNTATPLHTKDIPKSPTVYRQCSACPSTTEEGPSSPQNVIPKKTKGKAVRNIVERLEKLDGKSSLTIPKGKRSKRGDSNSLRNSSRAEMVPKVKGTGISLLKKSVLPHSTLVPNFKLLNTKEWVSAQVKASEQIFMAGYKFAKETAKEVDTSAGSKSYGGPTTRSKAQQIHLAHLPKSGELDNRFPNALLQDDSAMLTTSNPLYGDPEALFHDEDFPKNVESQFQGLLINDDDPEIGHMSVFATGAASIEEQLQEMRREMQRMRDEKDAEIAGLTARLAE